MWKHREQKKLSAQESFVEVAVVQQIQIDHHLGDDSPIPLMNEAQENGNQQYPPNLNRSHDNSQLLTLKILSS